MADVRTLDVWFDEALAGTLVDETGGLTFRYAESWRASRGHPISQSLPLDGAHAPGAAASSFGGLLPEQEPRRRLAGRLGISAGNDFSLLERVAGDTAGALTLTPSGEQPPPRTATPDEAVEWLDDAALARLLTALPDRPMHADADGTWRLSLAGAQDKLPVVFRDGRVGLTRGGEPSTHIVKTAIGRVEDSVVNEAFCLRFARALGIRAVDATARSADGVEYLLVTRYDREIGARTERLHQENFCQALGIATERKYESEGGPGLADCFRLALAATATPALDVAHLAAITVVNFLVGNHDAHGKNFSLLYTPTGTIVAPAYDVLSTAV